ncbi:hypothetical protein P4637_03275 [Halalkalibacterium halodurans]|uniref:hypothetical protein n=1 Tax=Halalkalibacterium halodurans TaxID=86665 RepID=UPI002E1BFE91|nr:hypothetical protein [Halalkalibacterium halodurans]MED4105520.1 hypothetical protein [Halalkalibacterium halodurans]MED4109274.1 hypothetical protein [Halalkalibacterium halodurans]MED4149712.1 hypothetical protein [Halalkalibacterium halodurans]
MAGTIELTQITREMYEITKRMDHASKEIFNLAKRKAETERVYRMELAKQIARLRAEGTPATLIPDLARGEIADLKLERDMALELHRSGLASLEVIRSQANVLQTISRYQEEV